MRQAATTRTVEEAAAILRDFLARHGYTDDRAKAAIKSRCAWWHLDENEVRAKMSVTTITLMDAKYRFVRGGSERTHITGNTSKYYCGYPFTGAVVTLPERSITKDSRFCPQCFRKAEGLKKAIHIANA